jgi:hypothetical protein
MEYLPVWFLENFKYTDESFHTVKSFPVGVNVSAD